MTLEQTRMRAHYMDGVFLDSNDEAGGFSKGSPLAMEKPWDFLVAAARDLRKLASQPIGRDLLDLIAKRHRGIGTKIPTFQGKPLPKSVTIVPGLGTMTTPHKIAFASSVNELRRERRAVGIKASDRSVYDMRMPGLGSSVRVGYNPNFNYDLVLGIKTPAFVALGHELIHALHFLSGDWEGSIAELENPPPGHRLTASLLNEEARTVGAGTYAQTRISENAIRREHGLPQRAYYNMAGDCDIKKDAFRGLTPPAKHR